MRPVGIFGYFFSAFIIFIDQIPATGNGNFGIGIADGDYFHIITTEAEVQVILSAESHADERYTHLGLLLGSKGPERMAGEQARTYARYSGITDECSAGDLSGHIGFIFMVIG
jgi:hypothetical protein